MKKTDWETFKWQWRKKNKREERNWKANEETKWKLYENLGLGDCFERP